MGHLDVITTFYEAYAQGALASLPIAPDIVHKSPLGLVEGRDQFEANCMTFAPMIERIDMLNHLSVGDQVCVEVVSASPFGSKAMCEWFTLNEGLITAITSYFDASDLQ